MAARKTVKKVEKADREVSDAAGAASENPLIRAAGTLSEIGDQPQLRTLCAVTIAAGLWRRDAKLARTGVKMLAAHTIATWIKNGAKKSIDRTRPDTGGDYRMEQGGSEEHATTSFPSGHTAGAVAVAEAFVRGYPEHATAARGAAAAISLMQVPRAKHFLGDVVVGAAIGLMAERVLAQVTGRTAAEPPHASFSVQLPSSANLRRTANGN